MNFKEILKEQLDLKNILNTIKSAKMQLDQAAQEIKSSEDERKRLETENEQMRSVVSRLRQQNANVKDRGVGTIRNIGKNSVNKQVSSINIERNKI